MMQGYITRIDGDKDTGYVQPDGWSTSLKFRHFAIAPESGGHWPKLGDYVQFRLVEDGRGGKFLTDVRVLSPRVMTGPATKTMEAPSAGVKRVEGEERLTLDQVADNEAAARASGQPGVREVTRPIGPRHQPVETEWTIPAAGDTTK